MITLEIPIPASSQAPPDLDYSGRKQLVRARSTGQPLVSRRPAIIGVLADREDFSKPVDFTDLPEAADTKSGPKVYDQELAFKVSRLRGMARYRIPEELLQFREAVEAIAAYEHGIYAGASYRGLRSKVRMTVDQSEVLPGSAQRLGGKKPNVHRDGPSHLWQHIYVVTDRSPTEFFEVPEPGVTGEFFINPANLAAPSSPGEYEIAFANSTAIHRSPVVEKGGPRTFLRFTYTHATGPLGLL